jgi:XkdW protein
MTLYEKIMALYPSLTQKDFLTVIHLQNDSDGKGDYIAKWEHPTLARPTEEQLA